MRQTVRCEIFTASERNDIRVETDVSKTVAVYIVMYWSKERISVKRTQWYIDNCSRIRPNSVEGTEPKKTQSTSQETFCSKELITISTFLY
jgi:hypothetical protein